MTDVTGSGHVVVDEVQEVVTFGSGGNSWQWTPGDGHFDLTRGRVGTGARLQVNATVDERPQSVTMCPQTTAVVVVDMQNYFLAKELGRGDGGRRLCPSIVRATRAVRDAGGSVVWCNWGVSEGLEEMPPAVLRSFHRVRARDDMTPGIYVGFGAELPNGLGRLLVRGSWSAALYGELDGEWDRKRDVWVDKVRVSGFWHTALDSVLRSKGITTLLFCGVNSDQCVMGTLIDAHCLGYDTIMLEDCVATTSKEGTHQGCLDNARIFGFTSSSQHVVEAFRGHE
ncbi:hypothetical protein PYCC9005_000421 [Savitreella phatthalungensis]